MDGTTGPAEAARPVGSLAEGGAATTDSGAGGGAAVA